MPDPDHSLGAAELRQRALSRWDNEGGALASAHETHGHVPNMTNAELVQLRIRVIALENLVIALLAEATDEQRARARAMVVSISPRAGSTAHALTLEAAAEMNHLVDRAEHFKNAEQKA